MGMWLAESSPPHEDIGSPPLEGGEALCEFTVEHATSQDLHHIHVLRSLPSLLEENKAVCMKDVLPALQDVLPNSHAEVHLEASNSILTILERELVPTATFTETFLQNILRSIDSKDPVVANAWFDTLMDVIDLLPPEVLKKDILTLAITKGQHSQPVSSRLASCKVLGKICTKFESFVIKKEILPLVQSLCQDVDHEVRSCIAYQLDAVSRGLGLETAKDAILPWLVELANDEASYVRLASIETVVNLLSLLDDETCTLTIIPLVKKFCELSLQMEDLALPIASKQLGKLCHGLSVNLELEEKKWFLNYFCQLARLGLPQLGDSDISLSNKMPDIVPVMHGYDKYVECRQSCAYNFPAMVLFAHPLGFKNDLLETFCDLISDPHSKVRYTMACGLHEIARLLRCNVYIIQHHLVILLHDDCLEVIEGLVTNLPVTLEALAKGGSLNSDSKIEDGDDVISGLLICEQTISNSSNWRLHADFLTKLSCLPRCLTSDSIYFTFVPLFFQKLYTARPIPCRIAAATTLLIYLRTNPILEQRKEISSRLIDEFCHSYTCHRRMLFLRICDVAMELFSKAYFKNHFFSHLLLLSGDPVPNIRLRLCNMLPKLKGLLVLPNDQVLLQCLEDCVRKLMAEERDKDVASALRNAIDELDKIEIVDLSNRHSGCLEDSIDVAKEEEEKVLVQMEKKLRIRSPLEKDIHIDRPTRAMKTSKIPYLGRRMESPSPGRSQKNSHVQNDSHLEKCNYSGKLECLSVNRQKLRGELKSAIPLPKRMSFPSANMPSHIISPDSPMPSPETIRKSSSPYVSSMTTSKSVSSNMSSRISTPSPVYRNRSISAGRRQESH